MVLTSGNFWKQNAVTISTNGVKIDAVHAVICENYCLIVQEIAEGVGISIGSCHTTLQENLTRIASLQNS